MAKREKCKLVKVCADEVVVKRAHLLEDIREAKASIRKDERELGLRGLGATHTPKCAHGEVPVCTPRHLVPGLSGLAGEVQAPQVRYWTEVLRASRASLRSLVESQLTELSALPSRRPDCRRALGIHEGIEQEVARIRLGAEGLNQAGIDVPAEELAERVMEDVGDAVHGDLARARMNFIKKCVRLPASEHPLPLIRTVEPFGSSFTMPDFAAERRERIRRDLMQEYRPGQFRPMPDKMAREMLEDLKVIGDKQVLAIFAEMYPHIR